MIQRILSCLIVVFLLASGAVQAAESRVELWVPLTGTGTEDDPHRPDLPEGIPFSAEIPSELDPALPTIEERESAPGGKCRGDPAVTYCPVQVREEDAPKVTKAVPITEVPKHDLLLIELLRHGKFGRFNEPIVISKVIQTFDREAALWTTPAGKQLGRLLLARLVRRGLPPATADYICWRHAL